MQPTASSQLIESPRDKDEQPVRPKAFAKRARRVLVKGLLFAGLTLLVLNPNLKRAALQVRHTLQPDTLVQADFAALPLINEQIDEWVVGDRGRHSEARLVAKFVVRNIRYVSDYENWANVEYWPSAGEVWERRQEDCDGRAILATTILRSRGFNSARLVVGLDHMWIKVDENEKDPAKPPRYVALLSPDPNFSLDLQEHSRSSALVRLAKALLHPKAFCATSTHVFADIPALRKVILVTGLLLLCFHPCRRWAGLLVVLAVGLGAVMLLAAWQPSQGPVPRAVAGGVLLILAMAAALLMEPVISKRAANVRQP